MAICTKCGILMNSADMESHVCDPADIPDAGKPIKKGKTKAETAVL